MWTFSNPEKLYSFLQSSQTSNPTNNVAHCYLTDNVAEITDQTF